MVLVSGSLKHFVVQQRGVGMQRKDLMCTVAAVVQEEPPGEVQSTVQRDTQVRKNKNTMVTV